MLADALVERYSRQILLADVGGRGQERLCATHADVAGDGIAAALAASLLVAAGVQVACRAGAPGTVEVAIGDAGAIVARASGARGTVLTLVGRPCPRCVPGDVWVSAEGVAAGTASDSADEALGAVVAAEALRVALGLARAGRVQAVDLDRGTFAARPLPASAGCPVCAGSA